MHPKEEEQVALNSETDRSDSEEFIEPYGFVSGKEPPRRSLGNRIGIVIGVVALVLLSGGVGAFLSYWYLNLDQKCAAYTNQWCKWETAIV